MSRCVDAPWDINFESHDECKEDVINTSEVQLGPVKPARGSGLDLIDHKAKSIEITLVSN